MNQLRNIVKKAKLRLKLNALFIKSSRYIFVLACVLLVLAIVDRAVVTSFLPWNLIWIVSGVYICGTVIAVWSTIRVTSLEAASIVDERLQLLDRIATAITCEQSGSPFDKAVIEDAITIVETKNVSANLLQHFPLVTPKEYINVLAVAILVAITLWTPQWSVFEGEQPASLTGLVATHENIDSSIEAVLELQNDAILGKSLEDDLAELASTNANESIDAESLRREALKKITDVQKRLEELMQDENALAFEEMLSRMQALSMPKDSNTQPLVADLKNGKFDQAKKEFERLQEQMQSEELSEEEREQLSKSLENLAKQLENLSQANEALASALSSAGLNGNFASNPDAAMKAIKNAKDLTDEQKEKLLEMVKAQKNASQMCEKMGKACKNCASGKNSQGMPSELEKLSAMQMFKTKAQLAKQACQNAAQGMCKGGSKASRGNGQTGGVGLGNGGSNPAKETETTSVAQRSPVETLEGTIIARQLFEGGLLTTGESTSSIRETVLAQQRDAEQAIVDEEVPRRYHELLRHYFGQLEELTEPSNEDDTESGT